MENKKKLRVKMKNNNLNKVRSLLGMMSPIRRLLLHLKERLRKIKVEEIIREA